MSSLVRAPLQSLEFTIKMWQLDPQRSHDSALARARWRRQLRGLPEPPPRPPKHYPLNFAERSVEEFDVGEYLRRFAQRFPTLERAVVWVRGIRGREKRAVLDNGEVRLEE